MVDIDGKPFSTAVTGLVTLATCYIAGWTELSLLVLPLLVMVAFWLAFRSSPLLTEQPDTTARSGVVPAARRAAREIIFAEFERAMIQERVRAGLARAKDEGKTLGRPKIDGATESAIRGALQKGDVGMHKIAARFGVGTGTVQRIKAEMAA
jgi:hypothetical protein